LVTGTNGRILFDRPKPTAGCSANGRRSYQISISGTTYNTDTLHSLRLREVCHIKILLGGNIS
jgi:hypothetical protein